MSLLARFGEKIDELGVAATGAELACNCGVSSAGRSYMTALPRGLKGAQRPVMAAHCEQRIKHHRTSALQILNGDCLATNTSCIRNLHVLRIYDLYTVLASEAALVTGHVPEAALPTAALAFIFLKGSLRQNVDVIRSILGQNDKPNHLIVAAFF